MKQITRSLCLLMLFAPGALAQTPSPTPRETTAVISQIQGLTTHKKDFSVDFQQSTFNALRNKTTTQKGRLEFKPPRSFRWEVGSPKKEIYVSDGQEFWKYSEAAKHAQRLNADVGDLRFLDVLLSPGTLGNDYSVKEWSGKATDDGLSENPPKAVAGKIYLALLPKKKSKQRAMYAIIDKERAFVDELRLFYENGNKSRIVFGTLSDKAVSAEHFKFTPPPGTAVDK